MKQSSRKTKIVFLGTPKIAADVLGDLGNNFELSAVITKPDTAKGRHGELTPSETAVVASGLGLPVFKPKNKSELLEILRKLQPDLAVVVAFGMIFTEEMLKIPKYGFINLHYSLLPKYRGAAPYIDAILNGDSVTGVTITKTVLGLDEGDILAQSSLPLDGSETTSTLLDSLNKIGSELLVETIPKWLEQEITTNKQSGAATYTHLLKKEAGHIDWHKSAKVIERMVRAYNPWPTAYTFVNNYRLKLLKTKLITGHSIFENNKIGMPTAGVIYFIENRIFVNTSAGVLEILELQAEGKKPTDAKSFINGNKQLDGARLR